MTAAQCADYENQFVDSAGVKHGYWLGIEGNYHVLKSFGIFDEAAFCPAGQASRPYCDALGLARRVSSRVVLEG